MTHSTGQAESADALLDAIGPAFSRLRRHAPAVGKDFSRNLVLNVVADAPAEMTVGAVAGELGIDPSVASRMVSDCIAAGYLARAASQQDGRRIVLDITPDGEAARAQFARQQRDAFLHITAHWPQGDRLQFARLLLRYANDSAAYRRTGTSSRP